LQITFAEEIQGQQLNETSYDAPLVRVGRNQATCQIVFDQKQWPTVSRQHAQFEFQKDRWLLSDSGSTYGTFLDGQPVFNIQPSRKGILVFGNESRGISDDLLPFITSRITIPPGQAGRHHVESLNVASSVAVICAVFDKN